MRDWAEADPRHQAALDRFADAWNVLGAPGRKGIAAEFEREVSRFARRRRLAVVGKCAAFVIAAGLGLVAWRQFRPASAPLPANTVVHLPDRRTLPDGSVVELKGNAEIRLAYTRAQRGVVLVHGEAHFAVQRDRNRPFVVSAENVAVRAVGTAFDVQIGAASVQVLVTEGTVAVNKVTSSVTDVANLPPLAAVDAGKAVSVATDSNSLAPVVRPIAAAEMQEKLAWRKTRIEFKRTPLSQAVEVMNRHAPESAPRLVVSDPAAADIGIIGVFRPDNIEGFIAIMEAGFGIKAERAKNQVVLRKSE